MPIASTKGTVTGPVVTPALSQATAVIESSVKTVRTAASVRVGGGVVRDGAGGAMHGPWWAQQGNGTWQVGTERGLLR